jgi:cell division protein FtsI (penicillin-binding protein 3)
VLSFVGFAPVDDPRIVMLVMLDEPKNEKWGSEAAAPIFAAIGKEALRHLHVAPRDTTPVQIVRGEPGAVADVPPLSVGPDAARGPGRAASADAAGAPTMPTVTGLSLRQAMELLAPLEVHVEVAGRGIVTAQLPAPGTAIEPDTVCRLILASPVTKVLAAAAAARP